MRVSVYVLAIISILNVRANVGKKAADACVRLEKNQQWMLDSLTLNEDQKSKIKTATSEACAKLKALPTKSESNAEEVKKQRSEIFKKLRSDYKGILTEAQAKKLHQHATKGKKNKKPMDAEKRATVMTQKMKTELALTAEQEPKVKQINLDFCNRLKGLQEKKNAGESEESLKQLRKSIVKEHRENLKKVLTPEQVEKLKVKAKERRAKKTTAK